MNINNSKKHNMKRESRNLDKAHVIGSPNVEQLKAILENLKVNLKGNHLLTRVEMEAMERILEIILK